MNYVLTTNRLTKKYGQFTALNGLAMNVPKGSIYGLVGKNGAGKTTLLRIICGLQEPTSGGYALYGIDYRSRQIKSARSKMGAVIETPSIYLEMTAKDNLKEQLRITGATSFREIPELLQLVGLENTGRKKARHFSLGMRQRLGIAIALTGNPDFLILDEPVNGLDPQGIIEMRELLLRLNRDRGITILISSHILDELSRLATHYGIIDDGKMLKEISAKDLEEECQKSVLMEVTNTTALSSVLSKFNVRYRILSPQRAEVYDHVNVSQLVEALAATGCELYSIQENMGGLEEYYINLIGGIDND